MRVITLSRWPVYSFEAQPSDPRRQKGGRPSHHRSEVKPESQWFRAVEKEGDYNRKDEESDSLTPTAKRSDIAANCHFARTTANRTTTVSVKSAVSR